MKKCILLLLLLFSSLGFAQKYMSIDTTNYENREALIRDYKAKYKSLNAVKKKKYRGKLRSKVMDFYGRAQKDFTKNIKKKRIIFDQRFQNYADSLLLKLTAANPAIKEENIRIFISRHYSPNALNFGDGTIVLNLGLFKYLENEDQLVSVISHEIGHQLKKHVARNIVYKASLMVSEQKRIQAKQIKKQKYNSYEKAFTELKKIFYAEGKTHRKQEITADSLGYLVYRKANFKSSDFISALSLLAKLDTLKPFSLSKEIYSTLFDLPEQPFNEKWLAIEEFSQYDYSKYKSKIDKDSLRSHPEIEERIDRLKSNFSELNNTSKLVEGNLNSTFYKLKQIAIQEDIASLHYTEKYGLSTYLALKKLSLQPDNDYYKLWLGKNFEQLYQTKKKYQLNRHVDRLVPEEQDESYQQYLSFIWNLRLSELKTIADFYTKNGS